MGRPARSDQPPTEPSTESYEELVAWLRGPPRRSQALLAIACEVSQTTLSLYTSRRARPNPDSEVALLLQLATGGQVAPLGWLTMDERAERRLRRARATTFARAIATGRPVVVLLGTRAGERQRAPRTVPAFALAQRCVPGSAPEPVAGAGAAVDNEEALPSPTSMRAPGTHPGGIRGATSTALPHGVAPAADEADSRACGR